MRVENSCWLSASNAERSLGVSKPRKHESTVAWIDDRASTLFGIGKPVILTPIDMILTCSKAVIHEKASKSSHKTLRGGIPV